MDRLYQIRHSLAHIMAQAVLEMRPGSKLGFGPPIEDGLYYDFVLTTPLNEDDFPEIEKRMRKIIASKVAFVAENVAADLAIKQLEAAGEIYKQEYAAELVRSKSLATLSFYRSGAFSDMCEGPHVANSAEIPPDCFKIRSIAGAYWRGDNKRIMMTRIYVWAFENKNELNKHIQAFKDAQEFDHKKLGQELDIYVIDETVGSGLPLWLPNGTIIRDELEKLMKELEFKAGYKRVSTPHLTKTSLYEKTGHLAHYSSHIFPFMTVMDGEDIKETYCLKPMNCPHHHRIYASRMRSYRDLPLRLAEYGQVYRFEDSGSLSGLLRVRGMCMNDAHLYCREDQIEEEFLNVLRMHWEVYRILGIKDYHLRLSTWDPVDPKGKEKYVNNPEAWEKTQGIIRGVMTNNGFPFKEVKGEAAFYGPKIDIQFKSVTGREETASTTQLDFSTPEKLDLKYMGADGKEHRPYIIHRAPAGTHERFIAFLLEHYRGAFPTWLAPCQVKIIPVSQKVEDYAKKLNGLLLSKYVRSEVDENSDTLNKKIRNAAKAKVPNVLVVGEREAQNDEVTWRRHGQQQQHTMSYRQFELEVLESIRERR